MKYEKFQGTLISWKELFEEAAGFATTLGPARVVDISHSGSDGRGIVVVWYREEEARAVERGAIELELKVYFKRGTMISWDELFQDVLDTSNGFRPEQIVSFSHSDSKGDGIVALWLWDAKNPTPVEAPSRESPTT